MKKLSLIPLGILIVAGIIFASGVLFPNTVSLPRLPSTPGTIGGVLSLFRFDGTAPDASMLSGVYASGYLHHKDCSIDPINKVWNWVDANGQWICGNVSWLLAIAHFTEIYGTVKVWRGNPLVYNDAVPWESLYQWDLIESDSTGTGTIAFSADSSIIRFWTDTDLELSYGDLGWLPVAQVILNDGRLWGRILSATGLNLWGGGMVTGVRGTSIDINELLWVYTVSITDSVNTISTIKPEVGAMAIIMKDAAGFPVLATSTFWWGTRLTYVSGSNSIKKETLDKNIFYSDKWFVKNGLLDIAYMSDILNGPTIEASLKTRLNNELNATIIDDNTGTLYALLNWSAITNALSGAILLNLENKTDSGEPTQDTINKRKALRLHCKRENKTFFPALNGCRESWDTLAATDFGTLTWTLYGKKHQWNYTVDGGSNFNGAIGKIMNTGNYLEYLWDFTQLKWKTITIKYTWFPNSLNSIITFVGDYNGSIKAWSPYWTLSAWLVAKVLMSSSFSISWGTLTFTLPITGTISRMIVWNTNLFNQPIWVTITSITIE
jgi:hypothetical protein